MLINVVAGEPHPQPRYQTTSNNEFNSRVKPATWNNYFQHNWPVSVRILLDKSVHFMHLEICMLLIDVFFLLLLFINKYLHFIYFVDFSSINRGGNYWLPLYHVFFSLDVKIKKIKNY